MGRMENGIYVILGEVNLLVTAMRRNSRWLSSHNHQEDEHEPLITSFSQLKDMLSTITDLDEIAPNEFLTPFLSVIRSETTTGPITGLALTSINKFLAYGLIDSCCELAAESIENIADAVTHARFVGTDPASDEVVLMKILHVLRTLLLTSSGSLLSNESVCEIMQSCFRICFEMRLSELLRKSAEHTLVDMVQLLFTRLPQFKEDNKFSTALRKQLKMRTGGSSDVSRSSKSRKKSSKPSSAKSMRKSPSPAVPSEATTPTAESSVTQSSDADGGPNVADSSITEQTKSNASNVEEAEDTISETHRVVLPPDSLPLDVIASEMYDIAAMSTTPVAVGGVVVSIAGEVQDLPETDAAGQKDGSVQTVDKTVTDSADNYIWIVKNADNGTTVIDPNESSDSLPPTNISLNSPGETRPEEAASKSISDVLLESNVGSSTIVVNHSDVNVISRGATDFVNTQGVRFTAHSASASDAIMEGPPVPYGLPCVRELLRFLVSLINPYDQHNTDVMIHMGLSLLTVALESAADYISSCRSLLGLVKDDMAKNLIFLLKSERLSLFSAAIRVCFLLFESMRGHLKLQLEMYLSKLMEIIVSESNRVSYDQREIALESVVQLLRIPGLVTELYLNYDCDLYCTSLFEDLMKLLSKNAFPVAGLYSTHLLSLDALLAVIDCIEQHCHHRVLNTSNSIVPSSDADANAHSASSLTTDDKSVSSVVPPCPPASGFAMANRMSQSRETNSEWAQPAAKASTDTTKLNDHRIGPKIRPNRMKVTTALPTEEELATIKWKKKIYQTGTEQFNVKPAKGIAFLQEHGLLSTPLDPVEVARFLKENPKLDKKQIGEFISNKKNDSVLKAYQRSFNFEDTRIDEALRMYLESFRLPGEAPVISYLMEHFAEHWHKTNGEPFANVDAAFTLAYAVIMLNVDQHNVNAKKQSIPMTVENFRRNVSKVNGGEDFEKDMLDEIYSAIRNEEIVMPAEQVGLVRDNYLWKILMKQSVTKQGEFVHIPTGAFDRDLFALVWGPTVAALSFVFDKSGDEMIIQKAVSGFRKCAMISAHYGMSDVFDNLVISLCKFTTLLTAVDSVENIAVQFGNNTKAQLAARTVFGLTHRHSDILHDGWKNILDCMLQLYRAKLLTEVLVTVEDFLDPNGRISLIREEAVLPQRSEAGVLHSFYSYFTLTDTPQQRGPTAEEQEAIQRAQDCIQECHVEQLIMESKFLRVDSLQELLKAMIYASRCPDTQENLNGMQYDEEAAVFFLELLIKVILQNRDRMGSYWQSIQDHFYSLIANATEVTFLVERAVIGLLRLTIRLLRRDDIASQVLGSLRMLLMMKPDVIHSLSQHIAYGLHDLLKTNAANIHTAQDWYTLFTLIEVVGAGTNPPPLMQCRPDVDVSQVISDAGAQSDSEVSPGKQSLTSDITSDRGYTSDPEVYENRTDSAATTQRSPSSHGSWLMLNRDDVDSTISSYRHNQYSIVLCSNDECRAMQSHDTRSLLKCCETLAFLVRDAAHITPHNFTSCVHAIRTFVEAGVDGGIRASRAHHHQPGVSGSRKSGHKHGKKSSGNTMKTSRSSPSHLNTAAAAADDDRDPESYEKLSIQLLDLLHTLHTKAAVIYNSWAQETQVAAVNTDDPRLATLSMDPAASGPVFVGPAEDVGTGTSLLWNLCWCPLLQGIARLCCDARRNVRSQALTYIHKALLMHDLQTLTAVEWENCFNKVLFPLLSKLLEHINPKDPSGVEETRMRAATLLCKVFLQHLSPLLTLSTFTALWLTILEFMDKYMHADRSDLLSEAIPELLKNMLLVMHTAGILQQTAEANESKLWKLTWDRIDTFLPNLRDEVFKPHDPDCAPKRETATHHVTAAAGSAGTSSSVADVQTQQPMSTATTPAGQQVVTTMPESTAPVVASVGSNDSGEASSVAESVTASSSVDPPTAAPSAGVGSASLPFVPSSAVSGTQYILHPPLPAVGGGGGGTTVPNDQLATIPLLLNPDILQSSTIPVISPPQYSQPVTSSQN